MKASKNTAKSIFEAMEIKKIFGVTKVEIIYNLLKRDGKKSLTMLANSEKQDYLTEAVIMYGAYKNQIRKLANASFGDEFKNRLELLKLKRQLEANGAINNNFVSAI